MNRDNDKGKILIQRTFVVLIISVILIFTLIGRLYYLQIYQGEKYKTLSDENRISTRILIPPRGVIYDRNGVALAKNEENFQASLIAEQTPNIDKTLAQFRKIVPLSDEEIEKIKKEIRNNRRFVPIKLKENLSWEDVARLQLNAPDMAGVLIDKGLSRVYPMGEFTAHFLGYIGSVSEKEKIDNPLMRVPDMKIGKSGLEKTFEDKLQGKSGNLKLEVNAYGRVMKEMERDLGKQGQSVYLTIDSRLQKIAYEALSDQSGAAVALDVHTGEILAFVSTPSFDPNLLAKGISLEQWQELLNNEKNPLLNKVISGQYSPGSTFKIVVALAALEEGVIDLNTKINCTGVMVFGNHKFHCWRHQGHGALNVVEALKHSCDIFFYEVALKVGIEKIAKMARTLGLGDVSGVTLENEAKGLIPDKAWKQKKYKTNWQQGETIIAGIGQGYVLVTPLQLAVMLSRVVNGGYEVVPSFVKLTLEDKGKIKKLPVSAASIELVKKGMFEVVNGENGTAKRAAFNINGAQMGGKTGTTQVRRISMKERQTGILKEEELPWRLRNHALFIGFAPYEHPKYAVAVVVEHGSSGSGVAAPIASKILQEAVKLGL